VGQGYSELNGGEEEEVMPAELVAFFLYEHGYINTANELAKHIGRYGLYCGFLASQKVFLPWRSGVHVVLTIGSPEGRAV
jgi:hypothetical protein